MIKTIKGDLLSNQVGVIVHGCNAQGRMGSGVAAGVKARFPKAYEVYREAYLMTVDNQHQLEGGFKRDELPVISSTGGSLKLGSITVAHVLPELWIVNGVTQDFYGNNGACFTDYEAVKAVFINVKHFLDQIDPALKLPLLFPKIGAGRGGGDWTKIVQIIEDVIPAQRKMQLFVVDEEPQDCR
jgi:O-acetyl-ADP-ribose deacetylase (regulator of RNase III)